MKKWGELDVRPRTSLSWIVSMAVMWFAVGVGRTDKQRPCRQDTSAWAEMSQKWVREWIRN